MRATDCSGVDGVGWPGLPTLPDHLANLPEPSRATSAYACTHAPPNRLSADFSQQPRMDARARPQSGVILGVVRAMQHEMPSCTVGVGVELPLEFNCSTRWVPVDAVFYDIVWVVHEPASLLFRLSKWLAILEVTTILQGHFRGAPAKQIFHPRTLQTANSCTKIGRKPTYPL